MRQKINDQGESVLLLDAGDFYSGTLFHSLALQATVPYFPEYEFFTNLEYDGITLGNHEFDGGDAGFDLLMRKVKGLGGKVPLISTNFFNDQHKDYPIIKSKIIERDHEGQKIKIGIIGALGPNGCSVSKGNRRENHFIGYDDEDHDEQWRALYAVLRDEAERLQKSGTDFNILLFHGGTGEDDKLAKKLDNIDIIIAGHSHEVYQKTSHGKIISQAGSYARFLGVLPLSFNKEVQLRRPAHGLEEYHLALTKDGPMDIRYREKILFYQRNIAKILKENKLPKIDSIDFSPEENLSRIETGRLITQRILEELRLSEEVDFYFTLRGLIRGRFYKNYQYGLKELFNLLPIGLNQNSQLGYETVSFYLTKNDIYKLINFLHLYSHFSPLATPIFSQNLNIKIRNWGVPFINRIREVTVDGRKIKGLVNVATNTFIYDYLDLIEKKTLGMVSLQPRNKEGKAIEKPQGHRSEIYYFLASFGD